MKEVDLPPIEFEQNHDPEKSKFENNESLNFEEFGSFPTTEAELLEERKEIKAKLFECELQRIMLGQRTERYEQRLEWINSVQPEYSERHAEERLEDLTESSEPVAQSDK